jgi:DNA-directed RNA polymerase sigma subunit (sigma70/sigma32)
LTPDVPPAQPPEAPSRPGSIETADNGTSASAFFTKYLTDVPFISFETEERLLRVKDDRQLEHVTRSYLPLVALIASKYTTPKVNAADVLQETTLVLMRWLESPSPRRPLTDVISAMEAAARSVALKDQSG